MSRFVYRDHNYIENYATYNDLFRTDTFALVSLVKLQHTHIWADVS
jgi:hypothetical protein